MKTILHIESSSNLHSSVSREIGKELVDKLKAENPDLKVINHDLARDPVPHIGPDFVAAVISGDSNAPGFALSNKLTDELLGSDVFIIEAPMYNFGIPSSLKAWLDHVVRAQKTFTYTAEGPKGLLAGKQVIFILGSGGIYSDGPAKALDFQATYLNGVFGFLGVTDIRTIRIEGTKIGPEIAKAAMAKAKAEVSTIRLS